jgi:tripartite-type tricarboxylate transporter receptor subunit TctC
VAGAKRHPAYPNVPTVGESGGPAGFEVVGWTTLAAPKGLPPAVTEKIRRDVEKALAEPDFKDKFTAFGYEPFPAATREQFGQFVQAESLRFADVIKKAKASLD